jgi:hypothetical protein
VPADAKKLYYRHRIELRFIPCGSATPVMTQLLEAVRQKKLRRELVDGYLQQAAAARDRGDLEGAEAGIAKAREADSDDSRVRAAHVALARLIEGAALQAKARELLEDARKQIGARHFTAAMRLLPKWNGSIPRTPN